MNIVIASGGFDPLHVGHIKYLREAKKLGDFLFVIINNDEWLMKKKGYVFMSEDDRQMIIESLSFVDGSGITKHFDENYQDMSINGSLVGFREAYIDDKIILANGGDRTLDNIPEKETCERLGIEMVFGVGGEKIQSSSKLVERIKNESTIG